MQISSGKCIEIAIHGTVDRLLNLIVQKDNNTALYGKN
jgi:hypothetical protein